MVDVESLGASVDPVEDVLVEGDVELDVPAVPVGDDAVPFAGVDVPTSGGALGLAPPALIAVEMPPLERSLTLVETIVVVLEEVAGPEVEVSVALVALVALDPCRMRGAVGRAGMITDTEVAGRPRSSSELEVTSASALEADALCGPAPHGARARSPRPARRGGAAASQAACAGARPRPRR